MKPRLTVTYGVSWEISPAPSVWRSPPIFSIPLADRRRSIGPSGASLYGNLAPRLGFAYRPTRSGRTVIRLGAGLYFDSNLSLATDLVNEGPLNVATYRSGRNAPFSTVLRFGFPQDLELPLVRQWNVSIEHSIGAHDAVSIGYVGSSGKRTDPA